FFHYHFNNDEVEFVQTGYGKDMIKVLRIQRDGKYHSIKEVATSVQLTLSSKKDYLHGDNSDIIPTDTIKNTVHVLAKFKGKGIHFCGLRYSTEVILRPLVFLGHNWTGSHGIQMERKGHFIHSGIKDLKVLKTTQSGFEGFIKDQFTTLPEVKDRCFATQVYCKWRYRQCRDVDFEATWGTIRNLILEKFAGPYDKGEYSPSVQKTLYDIQVLSLSRVPEIDDMEISLPNIHYFNIDMSKMGLINKEEVLLPLDNPYGKITGTVKRKLSSRL
uniref:Uricase n=1 Tax=Saimiri boliviensis boliviensis TaxID=39432 RepID=A0A2K6T0L5_SAIBB